MERKSSIQGQEGEPKKTQNLQDVLSPENDITTRIANSFVDAYLGGREKNLLNNEWRDMNREHGSLASYVDNLDLVKEGVRAEEQNDYVRGVITADAAFRRDAKEEGELLLEIPEQRISEDTEARRIEREITGESLHSQWDVAWENLVDDHFEFANPLGRLSSWSQTPSKGNEIAFKGGVADVVRWREIPEKKAQELDMLNKDVGKLLEADELERINREFLTIMSRPITET